MTPTKYRYLFLFFLTTVVWGFGFLVVKNLTNRETPVYFILTGRFVLGFATLLFCRKLAKSPKLSAKEARRGAICGTALFAAFAAQTWGTTLTTPAKNGMLTGTYVLFVPLFLTAMERKIRLRPFVDAAICAVGLFVFFEVYRDTTSFNMGAFFSLVSGIFFAIHFLATERLASRSDPLNSAAAQLATVAVWAILFSALWERDKIDFATIATPRSAIEFLYLGAISTGFAYWSQVLAQSKLESTVISVVACLESIFAVVFSIIFGYETISVGIVVGAAIVLVATARSATAPLPGEGKKSGENAAKEAV
ncbi:MAG: DMT family transporter [Thermoguttaceae bacterium]|nr:DMT family transporter [Thermoguttaceae bacterium]